jgi:hypothetical protein
MMHRPMRSDGNHSGDRSPVRRRAGGAVRIGNRRRRTPVACQTAFATHDLFRRAVVKGVRHHRDVVDGGEGFCFRVSPHRSTELQNAPSRDWSSSESSTHSTNLPVPVDQDRRVETERFDASGDCSDLLAAMLAGIVTVRDPPIVTNKSWPRVDTFAEKAIGIFVFDIFANQ